MHCAETSVFISIVVHSCVLVSSCFPQFPMKSADRTVKEAQISKCLLLHFRIDINSSGFDEYMTGKSRHTQVIEYFICFFQRFVISCDVILR